VSRSLRVLDFDIENRPLSYWIADRPTAEITAIASCWADDPETMEVLLLAPPEPFSYAADIAPALARKFVKAAVAWAQALEIIGAEVGAYLIDGEEMLRRFVPRYDEADLVTGHYIRAHDLPIINGALMEYGLPQLTEKMTCDTKLDMFTKADIPATQEFLSKTLGIPIEKVNMTQTDWRTANRLTPEGIEATSKRVSTDVLQHMLLREEMLQRGMLGPPRVWNPGGGGEGDGKRRPRR